MSFSGRAPPEEGLVRPLNLNKGCSDRWRRLEAGLPT